MSLTTIVAQPATILRTKSWKVVMKYKVFMFFFMVFSRLWNFVSPSTYSINSVTFQWTQWFFKWPFVSTTFMFLNEEFFLLATIIAITEKFTFFVFPWQPLLGKQRPLSKSCCLSVRAISEKVELNRWKPLEKNCHKRLSFGHIP